MMEKSGRTDGRFFRGQGTLGGLSDPECFWSVPCYNVAML